MVKKEFRPNISFRVEPEFRDEIDRKSAEVGITRSELLQHLVYNILHYRTGENEFKTITVGKLKEILEPFPDELSLIAYTDDDDYALSELNLFSLIGGLKLVKLDKKINKEEWDLKDIYRE